MHMYICMYMYVITFKMAIQADAVEFVKGDAKKYPFQTTIQHWQLRGIYVYIFFVCVWICVYICVYICIYLCGCMCIYLSIYV